MSEPWYRPELSYDENYRRGPGDSLLQAVGIYRGGLSFGIPAGPLLNASYVIAALRAGYDISVYKTVRTKAYGCHPFPNVLPVDIAGDLPVEAEPATVIVKDGYDNPLSITNSFGVPSQSPDVWQPDMQRAVRSAEFGQAVIGSFQGTGGGTEEEYCADWITAARLVKETEAPVLEANLSCPNEGKAHLLCFDVARVLRIVDGIKNEIGDTPLHVKIAYFEDGPLREFVSSIGPLVEGISAINTIPARVLNARGEQALPGPGRMISGICGASISWAGLSMVRRMKRFREELGLSFEITGVGGVMTPEDYARYKSEGADVVMSATGAMWDPALAQKIRAAGEL